MSTRVLFSLACAVLLAACTSPADEDATPDRFSDSFEDGLGAWRQDQHLPDDPNEPGSKVDASASVGQRARTGASSLHLSIDGRQDDGTVWVERTLEYPAGASYAYDVSFWAWSQTESFNTLAYAVAYLGPDDPEREEDFPQPMQNSATEELGFGGLREPLDRAEGWEEYTFRWSGTVPSDGRLHLALGISAVWETEMAYDFDDVVVAARPQTTA